MRFQACRPVDKKYVVRIVMPDGIHELPPPNVDTKFWADHTAADFSHYGFNAVRAPACPDTLEDRQRLQHPQSAGGRTAADESRYEALVEWGEHCKR